MKRILLLAVVAVGLFSLVALAEAHAPITILGNSDFTKANGVVAGTGTAKDPYLITGWQIDVPQSGSYAVDIENTTAHFVLRGLIIRGAVNPKGAAIHLGFVSAGTLDGCSISNSVNGIEIASSTGVTLTKNVLYVQGIGLRVTGQSAAEYHQTIDDTNTLNDYPIHYVVGESGKTISGIKGTSLFVADSHNMTIEKNQIINGDGIHLAFVTDSVLSENEAYRTSPVPTEHGITLYRSDNNTIKDNILKNNRYAGLYLWLSSGNTVTGNQFLANNYGVIATASDNNRIEENVAYANPTGFELSGGSTGNLIDGNTITHKNTKYGIALDQVTGNTIEANAITLAETGIRLGDQADKNIVLSNTVVGAAYAISVTGSGNEIAHNLLSQSTQGILFPETYGKQTPRGNVIHDNTFADDPHDIYLNKDSVANLLYGNIFLGKGSGLIQDFGNNTWTVKGLGNYYADYTGADKNADGIGDTPVTLYPSGAQDTAPLMTPKGDLQDLGVLSTLKNENITITTKDGTVHTVPVVVASQGQERFIGFRGFPAELVKDFPGILFVFEDDAQRYFTMETVPFDLDIAFFNSKGNFAGGATMKANATDLYTSKGPFQYAVELQSGSLARLGITDGSTLSLP
jgi:parallel beta-helix repeat protein